MAAAQELCDLGVVEIEEADLASDWQRPGFVLSESSVGVLELGRLVAYAELGHLGRCDTAVHPDHRDRGIGTWLVWWLAGRPAPAARRLPREVDQREVHDTIEDAFGEWSDRGRRHRRRRGG